MKRKRGIWRESLDYLKDSRNFIYLSIILFLAGTILGFAFPELFSFYFDDVIRELVEKTANMGVEDLIFFIFQNNILSVFMAFIFGVFLGIFPIFNIVVNGTLLGYVMSRVVAAEGAFSVWRIVPHGIFELPAIFISVGLGVKLGLFWFSKKGRRAEEFRERFWGGLKVFATIVIPLLIIAAVVEGILIGFSG